MSDSSQSPTSTFNLFSQALSGGGKSSTPSQTTEVSEETDQSLDASSIEIDSGSFSQEEDSNQDSSLSSESESEGSEKSDTQEKAESSDPNVEFIKVQDPVSGRKVKVKVDYSDKDSIKRAFSLAAGARKWQHERDILKKELTSFKEGAESKVKNWDTISQVYEDQGVKGLINFLEGRDDAFDLLVEQQQAERDWLLTASPEEIELKRERESKSLKDRELEKLRKEIEEIKSSQMSQKEQQELNSLKSDINPVFDKYRFAGKLGNPGQEEMLDQMLWNSAMKNLESYPEDQEISPAVINKIFQSYANNLRGLINKQAEKQVSKVVSNKKREATENLQTQAAKGMKVAATSNKVTAQDLLKQGRLSDIFKFAASKNKNFMGS